MVRRADLLGHTEPTLDLWCASQHHKHDPTQPASKWTRRGMLCGMPPGCLDCGSTICGTPW